MSERTIYERNYHRLVTVLGDPAELTGDRSYHYRAPGFMDLTVEVLPPCEETGALVLSLCHYFEMNGDLCQDPEMTIRVVAPGDGHAGMVEALTFQQSVPPIYSVVYPESGKVDVALKDDLNSFLASWLRNIRDQGLCAAAHKPCYVQQAVMRSSERQPLEISTTTPQDST